jgi:hypothetical protein
VQADSGKWKDQLDEVLKLDEVLDNVDQLDELAGGEPGRN